MVSSFFCQAENVWRGYDINGTNTFIFGPCQKFFRPGAPLLGLAKSIEMIYVLLWFPLGNY